MAIYKVNAKDMPVLLQRFGLPADAAELEVELVENDSLRIISVFNHSIGYHKVPNGVGCVQTGTRTTITQQLPFDLTLYRHLRCLIEGVQ